MKINWGTGLVIGMALFISFILYFVVQIMTKKEHEFDLVTEDYFSREMVYQEELDAEKNSINLAHTVVGKRTASGWLFVFPEEMDPSKISGSIHMYRPSDKDLDFLIPIKLKGSEMLIPDSKMTSGRWNTIVNWKYNGVNYRTNKEIDY